MFPRVPWRQGDRKTTWRPTTTGGTLPGRNRRTRRLHVKGRKWRVHKDTLRSLREHIARINTEKCLLKEDLKKARDKNEKLQATLNEFNEMFGMIGAVTHARMVEDVTLATIAARPAPHPHLLPRAKSKPRPHMVPDALGITGEKTGKKRKEGEDQCACTDESNWWTDELTDLDKALLMISAT